MNTDPLNDLWNSATNQPDAEAGPRLAAQFTNRLRKRRRFQAWWLGWTVCAMTAVTILAIIHVVRNGVSGVADQWPLLPLLALPWFVTLRFLRAFLRAKAGPASSALPLQAALIAARASNLAERRHFIVISWLFAAMTPLLALAVWQLHLGGKASVDQAWSMALAFGTILASSMAIQVVRYRRRLLPEKQTIDTLLRDLDAPAAN